MWKPEVDSECASLGHFPLYILRQSFTESGAHQLSRLAEGGQTSTLLLSLTPEHWDYSMCCHAQVLGVCWGPNRGLHGPRLDHFICSKDIKAWGPSSSSTTDRTSQGSRVGSDLEIPCVGWSCDSRVQGYIALVRDRVGPNLL